MAKPKRNVVLNLQQLRADRSAAAPVIVGPDGKEYPVSGVPLDGFLAIIEMQQAFAEGGSARMTEIIPDVKALVESLLPGFPVGGLTMDELMAVIAAMQTEIGPQAAGPGAEGTDGDEPGE